MLSHIFLEGNILLWVNNYKAINTSQLLYEKVMGTLENRKSRGAGDQGPH